MDTWIRSLTQMDSSRGHWTCEDSEIMIISLPINQHTLECREVLCRAPLNGGRCIGKAISPLRGFVGDLAMEVMDDFFLFFVLGHVATKMIGDDRPYPLVLGMMSSLNSSLGMVPKFTYNSVGGISRTL